MTAQTFSLSEEVLRVSLCVVVDDVSSLDRLSNPWIFYSLTHIFGVNVWRRLPSMTCDRCSSRVFFCFLIGWKADLSEESLFHHTLWIKMASEEISFIQWMTNGSSRKKILIFGKTTFWKGCFKRLFDQGARDISDEVQFFTRPQVIPAFCSFIFKRITCFVSYIRYLVDMACDVVCWIIHH